MPRNVKSNLDPEEISEALLDTFTEWVDFALGEKELGGKTLKAPSGRMASAMRAETDQDGNVVAVYFNTEEVGAMINEYMTKGHREFSLKDKMLQPGKPGVHETKLDPKKRKNQKRYLYRYIPISDGPTKPLEAFDNASYLTNLFTSQVTDQGGVLRLNRNAARLWAMNHREAHSKSGSHVVTMSNRPGSAKWIIPQMPAFNVSKLLRDMVPAGMKDRIII